MARVKKNPGKRESRNATARARVASLEAALRRSEAARKCAEKDLRAAQNKLQNVLSSITDGLLILDKEWRCVYFNKQGARMIGKSAESIVGGCVWDVFPEAKRAKFYASYHRAVETGEALHFEDYLPEPLNKWLECQCYPSAEGLSIYFRDITERKHAEEALQNSERVYRAIGEVINYGIWVCTPEGKIIYNSESFLRMLGMTQRECYECKWQDVLHPDDGERTVAMWRECVKNGTNWDCEHRYRGVDGQWHPVLSRGAPVRDAEGQTICWAGINLDMSRLKLAERALLRSEKLASMGRMAATIAHEINNPLEAIGNLLFLARSDSSVPAPVREYIELADAELKRVANITRQSLGFYRESNAPAPSSVTRILASALDVLKNKIKAKHVACRCEWVKEVSITAVAGELRQVFSNLLSNSLDAIGENGTIRLRVTSHVAASNGRPCVRITIADNGKGIDYESRQRIFEPFFTTKGTTGTGLGLWVSKQIVEKHGGTIQLRSSTRRGHSGTIFSVVLPIQAAPVARTEAVGA